MITRKSAAALLATSVMVYSSMVFLGVISCEYLLLKAIFKFAASLHTYSPLAFVIGVGVATGWLANKVMGIFSSEDNPYVGSERSVDYSYSEPRSFAGIQQRVDFLAGQSQAYRDAFRMVVTGDGSPGQGSIADGSRIRYKQ